MRLTFDRLWIVIAVVLPGLVALIVPMPAVDLAYQVRVGGDILLTGAVPVVDTWTFTVAGTSWVDQQWLSQVLLALGYGAGGWELLAVVRAGLVALSTGLLVAVAISRGAAPRTAAILSLAAFMLVAPGMALRPQLLGIVLFAAILLLVALRERHQRAYLAAPLVIVAWANVHGSFVLGPLVLGYAWAEDLVAGRPGATRSLVVFVAGTLATLLNPYGAGVWVYAAGIGANPGVTQMVTEWQRTSPLRMPGGMFYPAAIAAFVLLVRGRSRVSLPAWGLALVLTAMAVWAERGVAWWAMGMVYLLGGVLASAPGEAAGTAPVRRASRLNGAIAVLLGVLVLVALPWWRPPDPLTGRAGLLSYAPSGLARELGSTVTPGQRVVVAQTWGSWFEWAVPQAAYFVDSRFELFPAPIWADYDVIGSGDPAPLDGWLVDIVVASPSWEAPAGWRAQYSDADGVIWVREDQEALVTQ
jgi:hypothetical protein